MTPKHFCCVLVYTSLVLTYCLLMCCIVELIRFMERGFETWKQRIEQP